MPVYSMTGYASVQSPQSNASLQQASSSPVRPPSPTPSHPRLGLEIRSVNSRFLDLGFRLSDELRHSEAALRELVVSRLKRGKVELRAFVGSSATSAFQAPNPALLQSLGMAQDTVLSWLPQAQPLSVAEVLRMAGTETAGSSPVATDWSALLLPLAAQALDELQASRAREGQRLADMLLERTAMLRQLTAQAVPLVPQLVEQQRQRFIDKFQEALAAGQAGSSHPVSPQTAQERALTEATVYAIRIDVAEEVTRLAAHLEEIERLLNPAAASSAASQPAAKPASKSVKTPHNSTSISPEIGKRLDFVIQELHREANTLGSKSSTLELTRISVDMKVLIEQMREQVQNIE